MSIEVLSGSSSLEDQCLLAAKRIFETLAKKPGTEPQIVGLCGGRSVVGLLKGLQRASIEQPRELLRRLHFFMVDERVVPLASPDSNFGGLKSQLFDSLIADRFIEERQLHPFVARREDAEERCEEYLQELSRLGKGFSVVVLGMGEDGHVAGLFPNHPVLKKQGRGFSCFFDSPKLPVERMTANRDLVVGADLAVLLALGEGKREAWVRFNNPEVSEKECPAKLVNSMKRCVVITDLS
jgi:6-phosphogluconolactonase